MRCPYCDCIKRSTTTYAEHIEFCSKKPVYDGFSCSTCDQSFPTLDKLEAHFIDHEHLRNLAEKNRKRRKLQHIDEIDDSVRTELIIGSTPGSPSSTFSLSTPSSPLYSLSLSTPGSPSSTFSLSTPASPSYSLSLSTPGSPISTGSLSRPPSPSISIPSSPNFVSYPSDDYSGTIDNVNGECNSNNNSANANANAGSSTSSESDKNPWYPFTGEVSGSMWTWWRTLGRKLPQTSFDNLLGLQYNLLQNSQNIQQTIDQWPRSLYEIMRMIKPVLTVQPNRYTISGGFVEILDLEEVCQLMYGNLDVYSNIHFNTEETELRSELYHCEAWKEQQNLVEIKVPGSKFLPLVAYSDKALISSSSGGKNLHPVYIFPAGLDIERRLAFKSKFLVAYISQNGSNREAFLLLSVELHKLETGIYLSNPITKEKDFVCPNLFLFLADMPEATNICCLFQGSCITCVNGEYRTKESYKAHADELISLATTNYRAALEKAKELQQAISYSGFANLTFFDPFTSMPPGPGHCESLGRSLTHVQWILQNLGGGTKIRIDKAAARYSRLFPNYCHFSCVKPKDPHRFSVLMQTKRLMAKEIAFVRAILPWIFRGHVESAEQTCIVNHVAYAVEYTRWEWSPEQVRFWAVARERFLDSLKENHAEKNLDFPKLHAVNHDELYLIRFGSPLNINELNCEAVHLRGKQNATLSNRVNMEKNFILRETTDQILASKFPQIEKLASEYIPNTKESVTEEYGLKGKPQHPVEDWDHPKYSEVKALLRKTYQLFGFQPLSSYKISLRNTLDIPYEDSVHASESYRHNERHDDVLLEIKNLPFQTKPLPWARIDRMFVTEDGKEWCLTKSASYFTPDKPLNTELGAPVITFQAKPTLLVPVASVLQRVILIPEEDEDAYGVCWFLDSGPYAYPHEHRYAILTQD